jgi:hypothetical protein
MARYQERRPGAGRRRGEGDWRSDDWHSEDWRSEDWRSEEDGRDPRGDHERDVGFGASRGAWFGDPDPDGDQPPYTPRGRDRDRRVDPTLHDQPFSGHAFPGAYGYHDRPAPGRPLGRQTFREEHSWRRPGSWYGADAASPGAFRGVGPKGYARSDDRVREHVCDALMDDPQLNAADIEVEVKDGEVTLSGSVESRQAKRHAEDLAEQATGVKDVHNRLRIASPG